MKVLHVIEAMHLGGAESMVVEHARHAAPDVVTLVAALNRGGPALDAAEAAGARTRLLAKGGARGAAIARLARLMRDEHVDVVNAHNPVGALYGTAAALAAGVRVRVRTEHSIHYPGRHSALYPWLEPALTAGVQRVVCVCDAVRQSHAVRMAWAADRFVTVRNGISVAPPVAARDHTRGALGVASSAPVALTVGSLTRQKAQDVLLDAWAAVARRVPGAQLWIAGDGPLREALVARAQALGIRGAVTFLGARGDTPDLLEAADLFVLSSVREGLSITLLEAMRAGRAVVATDIGGTREAVADGASGRVVPAGNAAALGAAIAESLAAPERLVALGAEGHRRWSAAFTAERMVRETEALYRTAARGARADAERSAHAPV